MKGVRIAGAAALAVLALGVAESPAHAWCDCGDTLSLEQEFGASYNVFVGMVIAFENEEQNFYRVSFHPIARWKGPVDEPTTMWEPISALICGYAFEFGETYLVFSPQPRWDPELGDVAFGHLCSRTAPLADNPYVRRLPPPLTPTPARRPTWGGLKSIYR